MWKVGYFPGQANDITRAVARDTGQSGRIAGHGHLTVRARTGIYEADNQC